MTSGYLCFVAVHCEDKPNDGWNRHEQNSGRYFYMNEAARAADAARVRREAIVNRREYSAGHRRSHDPLTQNDAR